MNKKLIGVIIASTVIAIAAIIATTLILKQPTQPSAPTTNNQPPTSAEQQAPAANAPAAPGMYADYSAEAVATTSGTKILFFHAPWCPQCRELEKSIKEGSIPAGVTIFKVDYDSNQALRRTHGVTIQTTLVKIDDAGATVKKYVAYNKPSLQALIENLL